MRRGFASWERFLTDLRSIQLSHRSLDNTFATWLDPNKKIQGRRVEEGELQNFSLKLFMVSFWNNVHLSLLFWVAIGGQSTLILRDISWCHARMCRVKPMTWKLYILPSTFGNGDHPLQKTQPDFNPHPHICDTKSFVGHLKPSSNAIF